MVYEPTPQKQLGPPAGIPILSEDKAVYFNGFAVALGSGDIVITLMRNGVPTLTLNASYTIAKTFGQAITTTITKLEELANHDIMTVDMVAAAAAKVNISDANR